MISWHDANSEKSWKKTLSVQAQNSTGTPVVFTFNEYGKRQSKALSMVTLSAPKKKEKYEMAGEFVSQRKQNQVKGAVCGRWVGVAVKKEREMRFR